MCHHAEILVFDPISLIDSNCFSFGNPCFLRNWSISCKLSKCAYSDSSVDLLMLTESAMRTPFISERNNLCLLRIPPFVSLELEAYHYIDIFRESYLVPNLELNQFWFIFFVISLPSICFYTKFYSFSLCSFYLRKCSNSVDSYKHVKDYCIFCGKIDPFLITQCLSLSLIAVLVLNWTLPEIYTVFPAHLP